MFNEKLQYYCLKYSLPTHIRVVVFILNAPIFVLYKLIALLLFLAPILLQN